MTTTLGERGPIKGRKLYIFRTVFQFGSPPKNLTKRVYYLDPSMIGRTTGIAALLPEGRYPVDIWRIAATEKDMPNYIRHAIMKGSRIVFTECYLIGSQRSDAEAAKAEGEAILKDTSLSEEQREIKSGWAFERAKMIYEALGDHAAAQAMEDTIAANTDWSKV